MVGVRRIMWAPALAAMLTVLSTTSMVLAQADSQPAYQTHNGPRTSAQLQNELVSAGYNGPWDTSSMLAAYERAGLPSVEPYGSDSVWSCMDANPSCHRDVWWSEWNEIQDDTHVTYSAIGSHFTTERRFDEAIDVLWQWPEGKQLLSNADGSSILVITLEYDQPDVFGSYSPQRKAITINRVINTAPTWMLADVLAHELSHAADDAAGIQVDSTAACLAAETRATAAQQRFLVWLTRTLQPAGLPSIAAVSVKLPPAQAELAAGLYQIGFSTNVPSLVSQTYDGSC